jgi:protein phosphatase methylesterase 1
MHHGAGSSGLSFAACAVEMRKLVPEIGVLSVDARGHGDTTLLPKSMSPPMNGEFNANGTVNSYEEHKLARKQGEDKDGVLNMSLEAFASDFEKVLKLVVEKMGWTEMPNLVLVGHSLGGAVVTHVAKEGRLGSKVLGYAVLDIVEGENHSL